MDVLDFLKENKDSRKIFGKRELKIIEKQLLGINLTQSEKNRLSRDIRPKFEFIKEASRFADEFKIKKSTKIKRIIEDAKEVILSDKDAEKIKKIILFGPAVENELTFRSDIDIAVKFDKINIKQATLFRQRISGRVNSRVDVQVYSALPKKIKKEIDSKGKLIYANENIR